MSLAIDGFWKSGFWSQTFWADGFWFEGAYVPPPADVTSETLGSKGKSKKRAKLPFYETKDYDSKIDLDEVKPVSKTSSDTDGVGVVSDIGNIRADAGNVWRLDAGTNVQNDRLVSDLLKELKASSSEIQIGQKPQSLKIEQDGLNEESAIILLLLTI